MVYYEKLRKEKFKKVSINIFMVINNKMFEKA